MIYNMDESTEKLTLYKTLQTGGAYGVEYFSIADKHFLAVANQWLLHSWNSFYQINYHDGSTYLKKSVIYKWRQVH